jgi:Family of unknown function (DUF6174)
MRILFFCLSMLGFVACTAIPSTLEGRVLWNSKNLGHYSYTLDQAGQRGLISMQLEVMNGSLVSAKYVGSGATVAVDERPKTFKVEAFFDLIDTTQNRGGKVNVLKFDAALGYPTQIDLDPLPTAADDEVSYKLSNLKAGVSPTLEGRALWASKNLNSYVYTRQIGCFCPEQYTKAMRLEVRNGSLTSAKYVDSGLDVPANFRPTMFKIEAFFDLIDSTRAKGGTVENLEFDPIFGYPTKMNFDPIPQAVDDESFHSLSDLKAL